MHNCAPHSVIPVSMKTGIHHAPPLVVKEMVPKLTASMDPGSQSWRG